MENDAPAWIAEGDADGSQDPARHDGSAALRHARLQRWDHRPHACRRFARRQRVPLRARPSTVGRVHAVAVHDHHRSAPEHPRRVDERCSAPGRRTVGRLGAPPGRLSHGDHRQAPLRTISRPVREVRRERVRPCWPGHDHADIVRRHHHRTAPWIRALRVGDPHRRRVAALREVAGRGPSRSGQDVLPGARSRSRGQRARRRRHRCPAGARQPDPPRVVPHRLGGRPHDRLARLVGRRRRLVLLDELSRPSPPVGPTGRRAHTCGLARGAAASGIHRRRRGARAGARRQATTLAGVVRRPAGLELRGPPAVGAGNAHRGPGPRGQCPQRRRVRAHRRGARSGARGDRCSGLG